MLYEKHIFVCENERESTNPTGCCSSKGAKEITAALKKQCKEVGLKGKVRVNKAGCLGQCAKGPVVVVYPEGVWYQHVTLADVNTIVQEHILKGCPVENLQIKS